MTIAAMMIITFLLLEDVANYRNNIIFSEIVLDDRYQYKEIFLKYPCILNDKIDIENKKILMSALISSIESYKSDMLWNQIKINLSSKSFYEYIMYLLFGHNETDVEHVTSLYKKIIIRQGVDDFYKFSNNC